MALIVFLFVLFVTLMSDNQEPYLHYTRSLINRFDNISHGLPTVARQTISDLKARLQNTKILTATVRESKKLEILVQYY